MTVPHNALCYTVNIKILVQLLSEECQQQCVAP